MATQSSLSNSNNNEGKIMFPPGFRFHPTDEEMILYYLKRKVCGRSLKLDVIADLDVYKWDPIDLPGLSKWKTGDRQWFFFTPRDRKYPLGGRSSRATMNGYWKATGKDRIITCNSRTVGSKKTLIYYVGRAPSGQRTDWVMHEYNLSEEELRRCKYVKEYYTLCKIFEKSGAGPKNGEQYGAPFVEEEWADDDDYLNVDALLVQNMNTLVHDPKLTSGITVGPEIAPPMAQINPVNVEDVDNRIAYEPSVITSVEEQRPLVVNEDFIELDDLANPQLDCKNPEPPLPEDLPFADVDGFCAFDFYNNPTTFDHMNPINSQHIQQQFYTSNLEYEIDNAGFRSYLNTEVETDYNLLRSEQGNTNFPQAQASELTFAAPSGVITDDVNQCPNTGEGDGSGSWFSSALWAYVESVPTKPASAMESSALVNKTFERMPSFSRVSSANVTRRVHRSPRSSSKGLVYFSVLGVIFAMLCVLLGTSVELLGSCIL